MTANEPGHINNLDKTQLQSLKHCWIALADRISEEASVPIEKIVGSSYGDELFRAITYDNPDVLILRWLRARKFDVQAAVEQLINTLKWRREWGVDKLLANGEKEIVLEELLSGKTYFMGRDREGRPVTYIHVADHIKDQYPIEATEKLAILSVETGRKLLVDSIETATIVVDMNNFGMQNMDYQLVKFFIYLLENHYPESLGLALVVHPPLIFHGIWAVIRHWIDPVVQSKIHFLKNVDELTTYIHPSNLPKRLNGNHSDFQYIPPTDQNKAMITAFRADKDGRKRARTAHRKASRHYLDITLKWAHGNQSDGLIEERKEAEKRLRNAFEQFVPYIQTHTYYHRDGTVNEPIFDIALKLWDGPIIIKPYLHQDLTEEESEREAAIFSLIMITNESTYELPNKIDDLYIQNDQISIDKLRKDLNQLQENVMKEIRDLDRKAERLQADLLDAEKKKIELKRSLKQHAPTTD